MHQLDYDDEKKAYGLIIDSVVGEDSGEYECGSFSRGRVTLNVYDRLDSPKITDPTHQMDGFSLNVIENEVVTLVCQLIFHENGRNRSREMMPILSWLNDAGEELPSSKRGRQPLDGQQFLYSRLTFTATNEYNHGNITCIGKYAGVSLGIQSTSIRLNVELYSAQFLKRFINWKILLATGLTVVVVLVIIVAFNIAPVFRTRNMKSEEIGSSIVHFDPNSESMVIKDDPKCLMNQSDRNKLIGERGCFWIFLVVVLIIHILKWKLCFSATSTHTTKC